MSASEYVDSDVMSHVLALLTPVNRLAIITSMVTGLRISDVLNLRTADLHKDTKVIKELKTGKRRTVRLPSMLRQDLTAIAGKVYVFESRTDQLKPRTRQAVYKDVKRAATALRCRANVTPHSARKVYAVDQYRKSDLRHVKELLNHDSEAVTMIYALSDQITERRLKTRYKPH